MRLWIVWSYEGPEHSQNLLMQFSLQQRKTAGFYSVFFWFMCVAKTSPLKCFQSQWKCVNSHPTLDYWNSMNACVLPICAYDNEAWDAVVCLTLRGCIIQFIHLMRPTCLAILICFQGERSNISETTRSKPSFNKSAPCLLCLAFKSSKQDQYVFLFFSKIVKYIFEQCSVRKGQQASFWNETKQIQERKRKKD